MREPIVQQCRDVGCSKITLHDDGLEYCEAYLRPSMWWNKGHCPVSPAQEEKPEDIRAAHHKNIRWSRPDVPTRKYTRSGRGRRRRYVEGG